MAGQRTHLVNGIVSMIVSILATAATARGDPGPYDRLDMILAVGVSAFLSGYFTSYFKD